MPKYKNFHIIIWQENKTFVAKAIENNISSFGQTFEEAFENIKEALDLYYEGEKSPVYETIKSPSLITYYIGNA